MFKKMFIIIFVIVLSMSLAGCDGGGDSEPATVKIAVSIPFRIGVGQNVYNAIELALTEAENKAGDTIVELLVLDTSEPEPDGEAISTELELELSMQAAEDEAVVAYIGPMTSYQAEVSLPILNEAGIVQIAHSTTWPGLTKPGFGPGEPGIYYPTGQRHFFRVVPSDDIQGVMAAYWADQLGVETIYIVDDGTTFGIGVTGIFELHAQDAQIEVVAHESLDSDTVTEEDIDAVAARVVEAEPDMLYFGGGLEPLGSIVIGAVRTLDPSLQVMGADGLVQDKLMSDIGADLAEGIYATAVSVPVAQLASATDFAESFRAAYDEEPSSYAGGAYEATKVLLYAIEHAEEPTRAGVLDAVVNLGDFSGVLGDWHFDEMGDTSITTISAMQIQDGVWVFVKIIE